MQNAGLKTTSDNVLKDSDLIIPDIHCHDINTRHKSVQLPFQIIKTHHPRNNTMDKCIFLFRNPGDALVSFFHYQFGHNNLDPKFKDDINIFVATHIDIWINYTKSFLDSPSNTLFISYEELHNNTSETLNKVVKYLNYPINPKIIQTAIDNHSFKQHKGKWKLKEENGKGGAFFRKGKVGSRFDELNNETLKLLNTKTDELFKTIQKIEKSQIGDFNGK